MLPYNGGKELLPVGSQHIYIGGKLEERPKIVSQYIIEAMVAAGVDEIIMVTRAAKQALMSLHGDGSRYGIRISYILQGPPISMPHSIDLAYEHAKNSTVVMGMPDTIVLPDDCVQQLVRHHRANHADLSLGLFPTDKPHKFGMIKTDGSTSIIYHKDKPTDTNAQLMWGLAVWEPAFTELLHQLVHQAPLSNKEMPLGAAFDEAIREGKVRKAYPIVGGNYYDIGTYDDYKKAIIEL